MLSPPNGWPFSVAAYINSNVFDFYFLIWSLSRLLCCVVSGFDVALALASYAQNLTGYIKTFVTSRLSTSSSSSPFRQTSEKSQPPTLPRSVTSWSTTVKLQGPTMGRSLFFAYNAMKYWKDFRTVSGLMALRKRRTGRNCWLVSDMKLVKFTAAGQVWKWCW